MKIRSATLHRQDPDLLIGRLRRVPNDDLSRDELVRRGLAHVVQATLVDEAEDRLLENMCRGALTARAYALDREVSDHGQPGGIA